MAEAFENVLHVASFVALLLTLSICNGKIIQDRGKMCIGTNGRMSVPSNNLLHYQNLINRYTNCTYLEGNLELTWLQDEHLDLFFLDQIREVTGYVLISHVNVRRISLPRLTIVRGQSLFKLNVGDDSFALMVTLSKMDSLELPALRDILAGSVGFYNNYNLCYIRTVNWSEILTGGGAKAMYVYNFTQPERNCPPCHASCEAGCWGEGPQNCQFISKVHCSPQCHQGRCFGPNPMECCHLFCAGGCTGPTQADCLGCRNFYDSGICKEECPSMLRYNPSTHSLEVNPEGKYAYGATCVRHCPEHLLRDSGVCVRQCPPGKKVELSECVTCDGPCPKNCRGADVVHADNIESFRGCTIIEGSITILSISFNGFQEIYPNFTFGQRHTKMHPSRLEAFSDLREVTGYVRIEASHPDFRDLAVFRNLQVIGGRELTEYFAALYIVKTSLESLNTRSLRRVSSGSVAILENARLCFADTVRYERIMKSTQHSILLQTNGDDTRCGSADHRCHPQCSEDGCWGAGPKECLSCRVYKLDDTCVEKCDPLDGVYDAGNSICAYCHEECLGPCSGPGNGNCSACRHVRDGPYCVARCLHAMYELGGECRACHENCVGGCHGPENNMGPRGCKSCKKAIVSELDHNIVEQCLKEEDPCPPGFYLEFPGLKEEGALTSLTGESQMCRRCHQQCQNCTAFGVHTSVCSCAHYTSGDLCVEHCPDDHYLDEGNRTCVKCAEECRCCTGPLPSQCLSCRNDGQVGGSTEKPDSEFATLQKKMKDIENWARGVQANISSELADETKRLREEKGRSEERMQLVKRLEEVEESSLELSLKIQQLEKTNREQREELSAKIGEARMKTSDVEKELLKKIEEAKVTEAKIETSLVSYVGPRLEAVSYLEGNLTSKIRSLEGTVLRFQQEFDNSTDSKISNVHEALRNHENVVTVEHGSLRSELKQLEDRCAPYEDVKEIKETLADLAFQIRQIQLQLNPSHRRIENEEKCRDGMDTTFCNQIIEAQYCKNEYYGKVCCASCTKAGQPPLDSNSET